MDIDKIKQKDMKMITLYIPEILEKELLKICKKYDRSKQYMIRKILQLFIEAGGDIEIFNNADSKI